MITSKTWDVITVGDVFVDLVFSGFPKWPQPGEEVFAARFAREIGGGAVITACGLAQLGLRVSVLAAVGREDGEWVRTRLMTHGVDPRLLLWDEEEPTGVTVSVSREEDRTFFTYMGANRTLAATLAHESTWEVLSTARHVHLACAPDPTGLIALARFLHEHETRLSLDVGWHPEWLRDPESRRALSALDLFFPNEREAAEMTGEHDLRAALRALADSGIPIVALKCGAAGALLWWHGTLFVGEPYPVHPVDPTGAGDCFDAGFLWAWLSGEPPERCLAIAAICGALSTQRLGGVAAFPTWEEIANALRIRATPVER